MHIFPLVVSVPHFNQFRAFGILVLRILCSFIYDVPFVCLINHMKMRRGSWEKPAVFSSFIIVPSSSLQGWVYEDSRQGHDLSPHVIQKINHKKTVPSKHLGLSTKCFVHIKHQILILCSSSPSPPLPSPLNPCPGVPQTPHFLACFRACYLYNKSSTRN